MISRVTAPRLAWLCAASLLLNDCSESPVSLGDRNLKIPYLILLFPGVVTDQSGRIAPDSLIPQVHHKQIFPPDTIAVLAVGETWQASANAWATDAITGNLTADSVSQSMRWSSDADAVATVDASGVITAHVAGVATITVSSTRNSSVHASGKVKVLAQPNRFTQIAAGGVSCGLTADGVATCWGSAPRTSSASTTGTVTAFTPRVFDVPEKLAMVDVGSDLSGFGRLNDTIGGVCGLAVSGRIYCSGPYGGSPSLMMADTPFTAVAMGGFPCALDKDGNAYCWTQSTTAFLAYGPAQLVPGGLHFRSIAVGWTACGLVADGTAYCWSLGGTPTAVNTTARFSEMAVGKAFACGVSTSAAMYCWGTNADGALGLGATTVATQPTPVAPDLKFTSVSIGDDYENAATCGLTVDGTGYCWGYNGQGGLGIGTNVTATTPTKISSTLHFSMLEVGSNHGCGLADGKTYCWGRIYGHHTNTPNVPTLMEGQPR